MDALCPEPENPVPISIRGAKGAPAVNDRLVSVGGCGEARTTVKEKGILSVPVVTVIVWAPVLPVVATVAVAPNCVADMNRAPVMVNPVSAVMTEPVPK